MDLSGNPSDDIERVTDVACPYCAASIEVVLDPGGASVQKYVEDCEVCCRPWHLIVRWGPTGAVTVEARTEDE